MDNETLEQKSIRISLEVANKVGIKINSLGEMESFIKNCPKEELEKITKDASVAYMGACYIYGNAEYEQLPVEERRHAHNMLFVYRALLSCLPKEHNILYEQHESKKVR